MNGFLPHTVLFLTACLLFSGCTTQTANEKRIEKNPALYEKLSSRDKELVRAGEVAEGMSQEAVFIAWGRPDRVMTGGRNGKSNEKWAYFDSTPVRTFSVGVGTGGFSPFYTNFGVHPSYGYSYGPGWGYGTDIDFVQHISREVEFTNGRVTAWERLR
ncbi:MAG: hypothetical protein P1U68_07320 [Verrucomicrobiales bacterium]|nr:hypothetical protein [Verrucomicrobiales bacterium]